MAYEKMGPVMPWWRVRMVWLAFGLPALVVVASFITLALAIHNRDEPLPNDGATPPSINLPRGATVSHDHTPGH
jgi:hypothetical protein